MATPLINASDLVTFLGLPSDGNISARTQLVCDLVISAVNSAAGGVLTEPYADGLKGVALIAAGRLYSNPLVLPAETVGGVVNTYGAGRGVLTDAAIGEVAGILGLGGLPRFEFPAPDYTWATSTATTVSG